MPYNVNGKRRSLAVVSSGECILELFLSYLDKTVSFTHWLAGKLLTPLIRLSSLLNSYTYPNHALDPTKANILHGSMPYSAHHWSGARQEGWYLDLLAVHPDYHGSGYGRELAQWGLKQAEKENVHASVMCSDGSEHFYLKCGFDEIVGNGCEGEGNPLNGVKGGAILFKYPKRVGQ